VPTIAENLERIHERIASACSRAGRPPESVRLLAVTKGQPPERVAEAAALGLDLFGENRVQEARAKIPLCPSRLHWHMIGHLQSNKSRDAVRIFEMIESVDNLNLARELDEAAAKAAKRLQVLLEVNVAGESSKFGWAPDILLAELSEANKLLRLEIHGLMTVAPYAVDPEKVRPVFRRLAGLHRECESIIGAPLPILSMGMSGDFEIAIEEGATLVRIGTALFGERKKSANLNGGALKD
jgi:pyridoxal phosphate enzyme (YggS family)